MMTKRWLRVALIVLDLFLAITALAGMWGLMSSAFRPPVEMLAGSPFKDYTIPALALGVLVGGGALVAATLTWRRSPWAPYASAAAGGMIVIFEIVEALSIGSPPGPARNLQMFYLLLGLLIIVLALLQWRAGCSPVAR
jgi:hypothetical protein